MKEASFVKNVSPFFSILIPTKNRSHLIADAINSVLTQTFQDFEIIIIDNDDTESTYEVIKSIEDDRIIYQRTGGLSMVENWEVGRTLCTGKYLTVLEDKLTYYPYSLECVYHVIASGSQDVVVWGVGAFSQNLNSRGFSELQINSNKIKSEELLDRYVSGKDVWRNLPRIINSAISQELVAEISDRSASGRFFNYTSPDLVAAFSQLALIDDICVISNNLEYRRSMLSNALSIRVDKQKAEGYFSGKSSFDLQDAVSLVPIKNISLVHNTVYNDFLRVRELFGGKLNNYSMCDYEYSRLCLKDTISTLFRGGMIINELKDISKFMSARLARSARMTLWMWWVRVILRKAITKYISKPLKKLIK